MTTIKQTASKQIELGIDIDSFSYLLKGDKNPIRNNIITLGQSLGSKGVMFVLYSELIELPPNFIGDKYIYRGNLSDDFETAIKNARKRCGRFEILVDMDETFSNRRIPSTIPFGKYIGKTVEEVFDIDYKYLWWFANNAKKIKSSKLIHKLEQYREIAKELIVEENKEKTLGFIPIESKTILRTLTITSNYESDGYGYDTKINNIRMFDNKGFKYSYKGKNLGNCGETIKLKCKVTKHFNSMGNDFNKINLR